MLAGVLTALGQSLTQVSVGTSLVCALLLFVLVRFLCADPLRHIPGPFIAHITPLWLWYLTWRGIECRTIAALHNKHGALVRVAPNEVDVSDGAALHQIYIKNGGLLKSPAYRNFDVDGFATIFSIVDPVHRAERAKAVAPMFAQQAIAKGRPAVQKVVDAMVTELKRRIADAGGAPVDVLNLFRALAMDAATTYLCGESFNGLGKERFSAAAFVDDFAGGGRFFYLPRWIFARVIYWTSKLAKEKAFIAASSAAVKSFAARVVDRSIAEDKDSDQTYQGRLLRAGISREEIIAQVVDIMFAGTDAASMTLAVLCCYLARLPGIYERARRELQDNPGVDAQSLPYLSGIVKESLRLSMANPTRLPRIVPPGGLYIPGFPVIPAGTSVGVSAYMLHHSSNVFLNPHLFIPERWFNPSEKMLRDSFYFGAGSRQCIARNLAAAELWWAAEALIRSDVLNGAKPIEDRIEILEWFNARVVAGKIELQWP